MNRLELIQVFDHARIRPEALSKIRPEFRHAKIKLTDNCNSKCVTCDYWKTHHENELTLDEFRSVLEQLRELGVEEVMFTGGEPTMRTELVPVVRHATQLGFATIGLTTNALSLPPTKIDQLLDGGLTQMVLSLEGLESHDDIRGVPGNTRKVLAALEHLSARRVEGAHVAVKLAMTLMERNLNEIENMLALARRHRAVLFFNLIDRGTYFFQGVSVDLLAMRDRTRLNRTMDHLIAVKEKEPELIGNTVSSLEYARRYFDDPKQAGVPCHLGYLGVDIDANGDVYSNCWGLPAVGNTRKAPLGDILQSDPYRQRCQAMFKKECPGCSCGYILNLAFHKPSVDLDMVRGHDLVASAVGYAGTQS
jgi:MoaA/NifB/PqqE/SkfB family radical SAM enzyme